MRLDVAFIQQTYTTGMNAIRVVDEVLAFKHNKPARIGLVGFLFVNKIMLDNKALVCENTLTSKRAHTMLVYRVEMPGTGLGPWNSSNTADDTYVRRLAQCNFKLEAQNDIPHFSYGQIVGTASYEDLEQWFSHMWNQLRWAGFKIFVYECEDVYLGKQQCSFYRENAKIINTMVIFSPEHRRMMEDYY